MEYLYSRFKFLAVISIAVFLYASLCVATKAHSAPLIDLPILQQQVTGVITDNNGLPIPGVAVRVKDSSTGTVTNPDGVYSINVAPDATLIFTYMGFETREVSVNSRLEINVTLEEDVTALGEVEVNAGYYHTTRRESTGNISRVTAEEIELQPVVSPIQALQGRMAGVEVINASGGQPGAAPTIRIRGTNSLREEGNYPLYVIDGVPVNSTPLDSYSDLSRMGIDPLNTMNLSNIESIEVLKDADATAIYGSRGANGVVLITTKRAREGKIELQARVYSGVSDVPNRVDMMNTQQYLEVRKRAFENSGEELSDRNAYDLLLWDQNRYTDWQDLFFGGTSPMTDVNLSVYGGTQNNNFRLSGSYFKQGTVYLGDYDYNKVTASLQAHHSSKDNKLNLDLSVNFGVSNNNLTGYISLVSGAFRTIPNAPKLFNDDGSLHWEDWARADQDNPMQGHFNSSLTRGHNLNSNLVVNYELINGLSIRTNIGYTTYNGDETVKRPMRSYNPADSQSLENRSHHQVTNNNSWIVEPQLIFSRQLGKSQFETLLGGTLQERKTIGLGLQGTGYSSEELIGNLSAAELVEASRSSTSNYRYSAIFARVGYNWDKKYFINLTGRRDGSSRFGPGKRSANFGAIGAAWIFSDEALVKRGLPFLSFGKLRSSYGTTGNDQIGDYGYLDAYEATDGPGGLYPSELANPDFSWEENKKLELGIELGFLRDKLNLGLSWYQNRSSNQLVGYPLPALTGFATVQANLPATVENTGWELELSTYNIQNKNFNWQTSLNFSLPRNRLVSYPDIEQSSYANIYRVGHPLDIAFQYEYAGLDPDTGFYTFIDANEDGSIDVDDRTEIWDRGREFFGGISNNLRYKNFSLNFLFQFVKQEGTFTMLNAGFIEPLPALVYEAIEPGSKYQQISNSLEANRAYSNATLSNFPIEDASFLRLKTLSVGYELPEELLHSIGLQTANIFINGYNLFTITPYKGLDPERPLGGRAFAGMRTFSAGVQLTL